MNNLFNKFLTALAVIALVTVIVLYGLVVFTFIAIVLALILVVFVTSQLTGQRVRVTKDDVVIGYIKWFRYIPVDK